MPETDVAATPAAIPSESSSLGGGGGAIELSDEDILGISSEDTPPAAPPAAEPETPEAAAPAPEAETKEEETQPPATPATATDAPRWMDNKFMRPLLNDKVYGPVIQSMRDSLLAHQEIFATVADARAVKELLPGGAEELKNLVAIKKETDEMDFQFFGGDPAEQRPYLETVFREGPEAFQSAVQIGLEIIKAQKPQEWAYLTNHTTGESLQSDKVWDWLRYINEKAEAAGNEEVSNLLNQFAGIFQKYGLGPSKEEDPNQALINRQNSELEVKYQKLEAERRRDFNAEGERIVMQALDGDIGGHLLKLLPKTSDGLRARFAKDVYSEIENTVKQDSGLKLRLANLLRTGGYNRQTQEQMSNLFISRARQIMPGVVKKIVNAYTADVMARRTAVTDKQNQAASRVDVSSGARPGTGVRPITAEEASKMSDMDILESDRPFVKRR